MPPAPVWVPNQRQLARVSCQSANDNEVTPGAVYISIGIYLTVEKYSGKTRQETDDGWTIYHRLKWGPMPPNYIGRIAQQGREEVRKKRKEEFPEGSIPMGKQFYVSTVNEI